MRGPGLSAFVRTESEKQEAEVLFQKGMPEGAQGESLYLCMETNKLK